MRAITLWQPHASLVAEKIKNIETRGRRSPWSSAIGETIAIHAAMREPEAMRVGDWSCGKSRGSTAEWALRRTTFGSLTRCMTTQESHPLPLGAVVATCTLVDVVPMTSCGHTVPHICVQAGYALLHRDLNGPEPTEIDVSDQLPFGDFTEGRFALILDNVQKIEPFPCRGFQGLWKLPDHVADNLVARCA